MKPKYLILLIVCSFICFEMGNAYNDYYGFGDPVSQELESKYGYSQEFWDWWEQAYANYMAKKHAWEMGYLQAWNENMQKGIKRLNNQPQQIGVTPVNGALLLNETDVSVPGRHGGISVTRFYNSKIWSADTMLSYLKGSSWMGSGWDLHFGKILVPDDSGKVFETSSGMHIYFKHRSGAEYISTDGSFMLLQDNTIKTGNGARLIFDFEHNDVRYLTKTIDPNGNVTNLYYDIYLSTPYYSHPRLDSLRTSTNEKIVFHYHFESVSCNILDSIKFIGFDNIDAKIIYHYDYDCWTASSPFGSVGDATFLLKSVIYPNGDSIYYDYNVYFELTEVHTTGSGLVKYEITTDTFYIPDAQVFPPDENTLPVRQFTRGIEKVKSYDPWTAPDTNIVQYIRDFTESAANRAVSNADSVTIYDPDSNYQVFIFRASRVPPGDAEAVQWNWDNGELRYRKNYDSKDTFLGKVQSFRKLITPDNIAVLQSTEISNEAKTYRVNYYEYDDYGNARLIHECGDNAIDTDDRWIHREYAYADTTFWLKNTAGPPTTSNASFFSRTGVDTLIIQRKWSDSVSGPWHDMVQDTFTYSPAYSGSESVSITSNYNYARVDAWVYEYNTDRSLHVWAIWDLRDEIRGHHTDNAFAYKQDYPQKYILHLVKEQKVCSDSAGTDTLSMTHYFYDDTSYIVTTYTSPDQWETPPDPPDVRGNLTRVEQWKGGSNHTKSELRYDNVGNVVMSINYPDANSPETTFTYYNSTYEYAYPWRTVTHLESGDSLCSRTEYDLHTGLVTRSVDESNADSTRYAYDNMNRLKKIYFLNETSASKRITYQDSASPEAVIDSTYLDFTGEIDRWIVSKSFYDGFGRLIQTKNFDYDNTRTITQSFSYNGNGLKDSVSNPYEISGTSMSYSSPNWGSLDITSYEYDGLNRIAKVIHPDAKNIIVKYYANTDTIYDEKGNKTIHIYNAYGAIDTIINALNDTTSYQYDTLGRLTKVTDAKGKETKYYYDILGRLKGVNGPDAKSSYFYDGDSVDVLYDEYDDIGNLKLKKDPNGWIKYSYDNINRLTKIELSINGGTAWSDKVKFTYDSLVGVAPTYLRNPKGRLSRMITCGVDTIKYFYDDRGRLGIKRVNINGLTGEKTINYRFNYANLCTLINISPSYKTTYQYNRLGQTKSIPNLASTFKYNPAGQIVKLNYTNSVIDTITYDNRLRPTQIRVKKISDIMKLGYTYQDNSNVASITDYINNNYTQAFAYDDLNRLTTVTSSAGNQSFTYDKVGNRTSKNSTNYQYYTHTNRLAQDHRNYTYDYDDNGNIIRHQSNSSTVDSFTYDWNNRLIYYKKGTEEIDFAYNASGLRVKKHYHITDDPKGSGEFGSLFFDASNDLGIKSRGLDSVYNKGRDIEKVWVKNSPQYLDFTLIHRHVFNEPGRLKLFITLDLDTIPNSGRITLPEDTLTKVSKKCAWEYCIYVNDNDYGFYQTNGVKTSMPFGMLVVKTPGPSGIIKVKISKSLINNPDAIRYTIATFAPSQPPNLDTLFQGGSSATDVFPGTRETFGGEINGYGESTPLGDGMTSDYTIYYLYNGINPIVEYAPNGSILVRYIYAGSRHIAKIAGADTHWYHCDALGSPRKMTDERGSTVWSATYYPFGEMTAGSNNTHGFTGKEFDSEMGLNYFCQRYYDPEIGRFTTLDPQNSPASSPYAYCANCPLVFIDPTGAVMHVCTKQQDLADNTSGGPSVPYWGAIHSWALMDPGLFGGPAHDIVSFGSGFYHWDYETGTWTGYGEPFTSPEAFANTLSDLMGGYITAYGEPWYKGDTPLTQGDITAAKNWLVNNISVFADILSSYNFAFSLRNVSAIWTEKQYGGALYRIFVYEYLARECLPRSIGHELYEVHLINSRGYGWGNPGGPAHYETVNQMRNWFNYNSWYPYF